MRVSDRLEIGIIVRKRRRLTRPIVPPGIGWATTINPGHIVSNEPGFYLEGEWGIRIESVIVCKEIEVR